ncbi:MAG: sigma-E factor regulatory protein RseB domain-containing protein [Mycobacteriales bacterium]|jgi:sigma-E factor negative regulatory protein RseB
MQAVRLFFLTAGIGMLSLAGLAALGNSPATHRPARDGQGTPLSFGRDTSRPQPQVADALYELQRVADAERSVSYTGQQALSSWSAAGTATMQVTVQHVAGEGSWIQQVKAGGGGTPIYQADRPAELNARVVALLATNYSLSVSGLVECAGRAARQIKVRYRATGKLAGIFWVDRDTGLLLRRELYDRNGVLVRSTAFLDVTVGVASPTPPPTASGPHARERVLDNAQLRDLRGDGWTVPDKLGGSESGDNLVLYDARQEDGDDGAVLHLSYSDGLFSASLFAQRGRLEPMDGWVQRRIADAEVYQKPGLSQWAVWDGGDTVYTLIADGPDTLVSDAVAAVPHVDRAHGVTGRLRRGVDRVFSWLDPFD